MNATKPMFIRVKNTLVNLAFVEIVECEESSVSIHTTTDSAFEYEFDSKAQALTAVNQIVEAMKQFDVVK
jgi:hypothetical protein